MYAVVCIQWHVFSGMYVYVCNSDIPFLVLINSSQIYTILYIHPDRWTGTQSDSPAGLSFQAFLEAFMIIAKRSKLKSPDVHEMVDNLLHYCEANLEVVTKHKLRRAKLPRIPLRYAERQIENSAKLRRGQCHRPIAEDG